MQSKRGLSGRIIAFVILAAMLATADTYGSTLAAALFLNRAGAAALPIYYIFYAALSIPVSIAFSQVIDRWPRPAVFTTLLVGGALSMAAIAPAARSDHTALFYALYVVISVFEQISYSVFYILIADYFTSTETNRSTTALAIGMAVGGVMGGGLASLGSSSFSAAGLLFGMPALLATTLGLFLAVRRRIRPLGEAEPQSEETLWASLASFRPLIARYPIIGLLAIGVFLNIVVQSLIEYQVFLIYTDRFPDEHKLTAFLGAMNGVLNVVNILTSAVLTGPLLARIGVARMNLVYPAMTVSAFAALGASFSLPSAILGHAVYDPWAHSVDAPVFVSNYNAVPRRFVGRVRIFNDGLMYPLAMALTGAFLWLLQNHIPQRAITAIGMGMTLALLACGVALRRAYSRSLMEMLRAGSLDLNTSAGKDAIQVPSTDVRRLLVSHDPKSQSLGLELAARGDAKSFQREIESLLGNASGPVRAMFVRRFSGRLDAELVATVCGLLSAEDAAVRATAIEALVGSNYVFDEITLHAIARDPAREVAGVAAIEAHRRKIASPAIDTALDAMLDGPEYLRLRAVRVIRRVSDPALLPLLARVRAGASPKVAIGVLEAAAELGAAAPAATGDWARQALDAEAGALRRAAYQLIAARAEASAITILAEGLGDSLKEVRLACAAGLATFGETALPVLDEVLRRGDDLAEEAAIDAAGRIGGSAVDELLFRHLTERHFTAVRRNSRWLEMLPRAPSGNRRDVWGGLAAALVDTNRRALDAALATLAALGYRRTLEAVRGILAGGDERSRANAVETIASIGHRRFVQPLLPMLESGVEASTQRRGTGAADDLAAIFSTALADSNRWVRAGAVLAAPPGQYSLQSDPDPVVTDAIAHRRDPDTEGEPIMSRLIFLKTVPLFDGLSLDDLLSVDAAMGRADYLAGETIVKQGEPGSTLFILAAGTASVRLGAGKEIAQLHEGEFFGEMALFDDQPRSATVTALTDATLLTLERDRFSTLVLQRPEVLLHICKMFGNRLRETNRKLLAA